MHPHIPLLCVRIVRHHHCAWGCQYVTKVRAPIVIHVMFASPSLSPHQLQRAKLRVQEEREATQHK